MLVTGGAGGVARDLYAETVSPLRAYGLPEEHLKTPKKAPETPDIHILPSLANPTTSRSAATGLRSVQVIRRAQDGHSQQGARTRRAHP